MTTRWVIFNSVSVFILAYLYEFYSIFGVVSSMDPTMVTSLIFSIYLGCTFYIGWNGFDSNFRAVRFIGSKLTGIGLIGTVAGIMILLREASTLAPDDVIGPLFRGMGTVLITTLFGVAFNLLLAFQIAFCFEEYDE